MNSGFNYRRLDEMKVEAELWLRKLNETYQQMMMGDRANYGQQPGIPEEGMPTTEVIDANNAGLQTTGL